MDSTEDTSLRELDSELEYNLNQLNTVVNTLEDLEEVPTMGETHIERRMRGKWERNITEAVENYRAIRETVEKTGEEDYSYILEKKEEIETLLSQSQEYDLLDEPSQTAKTGNSYYSWNTV